MLSLYRSACMGLTCRVSPLSLRGTNCICTLNTIKSRCWRCPPPLTPLMSRRYVTISVRNLTKAFLTDGTKRLSSLRSCSQMSQASKVTKKGRLKKADLMRLIDLAKSEKGTILLAICCLVISSSVTMSVPFALGKILDIIFNKNSSPSETMWMLNVVSSILLGVFLVGGLTNFGRIYFFNSASLRIVRNLRSKLYRSILSKEIAWFDMKGTGELVNRLSTDTYLVGNSLSQNLSDGLRSSVMVLSATTMMIYTSPKLTLVSVCLLPVLGGAAAIYGRYVRTITRCVLDKMADMSRSAEERLANVRTVKSFSRENHEAQRYDLLLDDALKWGYKDVLAQSLFFGSTGMVGNIVLVSILYYGGNLVVDDALTIGSLMSFLFYGVYSALSINKLSNFYTKFNKSIGSADRLWEIIDANDKAFATGVHMIPPQRPSGKVTFDAVTFVYPTRPDLMVLRDFNMTLLPGQSTAIVGRSGSGKTTIASLLLRFYNPTRGHILLDDIDLKNLNPMWLRCQIGAVSQEPMLFSGTIRENIMYGCDPSKTVNDRVFDDVIQKAYVKEFITSLPHGLNTQVGERGVALSGGQKQRVAIARALIKDPTILIFDEATSALDAVSEGLIQSALEEVAKGRTVLTIAHRLSTIRNADKIAVMENGSVCEYGSYDDLVNKDVGIFKELVKKQTLAIASN